MPDGDRCPLCASSGGQAAVKPLEVLALGMRCAVCGFDERDREGVKRRAVKRLEKLGYRVDLEPIAAPAG